MAARPEAARVLLLLALILGCSAPTRAQAPTDPARAQRIALLERRIDAAREQDLPHALAETVGRLFELSYEDGRAVGGQLIVSGTLSEQTIGVGALVRHAEPVDLASAAARLTSRHHPDARRILVRALGDRARRVLPAAQLGQTTQLEAIVELIARFLSDADPDVRNAAFQSLADARTPAPLLENLPKLPPPPSLTTVQTYDHRRAVDTFAIYGALRTLLGIAPRDTAEVRRFLRDNAERIRALPPGRTLSLQPTRPGATTPRPEAFRLTFTGSDEQWRAFPALNRRAFVDELGDAHEIALRALEPILGRMHLPVLQLYLAPSKAQLLTAGAVAFTLGVLRHPYPALDLFETIEIAPPDRIDSDDDDDKPGRPPMRIVLTPLTNAIGLVYFPTDDFFLFLSRSVIGVAHRAAFFNQPYWLTSGLVASLTESQTRSPWPAIIWRVDVLLPRIVTPLELPRTVINLRPPLIALLNASPIRTTLSQQHLLADSGGYFIRRRLAHITVDYLRFRGFPEPEIKLNYLMGHLQRGRPAVQSLEQIYGNMITDLEADLKQWLADGITYTPDNTPVPTLK